MDPEHIKKQNGDEKMEQTGMVEELSMEDILKRERHIFFAEVNINVKKKIIHIFTKTEDIYSVIDTLFDKIEVKVRRYRDKLTSKRVIPLKESVSARSAFSGQGIEETT